MPRVRMIPAEEVDAEVRPAYQAFAGGYGSFAEQVGVLAHVPSAMLHLTSMLLELRERRNTPLRYVEMAVVVVSMLNKCHFCVDQHRPLLQVEGISAEGVDGILDYANHPELDDRDKAVVEYAIRVTNDPKRIPERLFERLRDNFSEGQIVELTLRIALCGFFNRFNDALQIEA